MKKSLAIALLGAGILVAGVSPAQAAVPAATYSYSMDGSFTDSIGSSTITPAVVCNSPGRADLCNIVRRFDTDSIGDHWYWQTRQRFGGGAVLDTPADIGSTYSLYFKFAIDEEANDLDADGCSLEDQNFSKILDFRNQASDVGLYTMGCNPLYISTGYVNGDASFNRGDVVEVVVTRDNTTSEVKIFINYLDGFSESFVYTDTDGDFIPADQGSGSRVRLFQDDGVDNGSSTTNEGVREGRLYGVKVWANDALTLSEIQDLATITPDTNSGNGGGSADGLAPTGGNTAVGAWVLGLALLAGAGAFALRRRHN